MFLKRVSEDQHTPSRFPIVVIREDFRVYKPERELSQ
jgi:hypothetical protein